MTKKDKESIKEIARKVGLSPVICSCGARIDASEAIKRLFAELVEVVRLQGELKIHNFGVFSKRVVKGRKFVSPLAGDDPVEFDDCYALAFRQTRMTKLRINDEGK